HRAQGRGVDVHRQVLPRRHHARECDPFVPHERHSGVRKRFQPHRRLRRGRILRHGNVCGVDAGTRNRRPHHGRRQARADGRAPAEALHATRQGRKRERPARVNTPLRIAMWSGPRNISTAMMRAWENRGDTAVIDEPFYAHYLQVTGVNHPGREEVLRSQSTAWEEVAAMLTGPIPDGKPIWYQKHMTQHILPDMPLDWLDQVTNCFLIRNPESVVASFTIQRPDAAAWELGF